MYNTVKTGADACLPRSFRNVTILEKVEMALTSHSIAPTPIWELEMDQMGTHVT